jgi:hypothetical protein
LRDGARVAIRAVFVKSVPTKEVWIGGLKHKLDKLARRRDAFDDEACELKAGNVHMAGAMENSPRTGRIKVDAEPGDSTVTLHSNAIKR